MTPIEAAIKGSNEIFCSNFYFYHAGAVFLPVIFLEGFVGRLRIWCRNRCCRFNFGICILNIDTNAKCLFNEGGEQKIKILLTEPYFKKLNSNYAEALERLWVKNGGVSLSFSLVLD
jgi:HAE1 family hydrophobic/amphiphilic exporter-1/multidrug efflux pump